LSAEKHAELAQKFAQAAQAAPDQADQFMRVSRALQGMADAQ
jgi:hypothetical protein